MADHRQPSLVENLNQYQFEAHTTKASVTAFTPCPHSSGSMKLRSCCPWLYVDYMLCGEVTCTRVASQALTWSYITSDRVSTLDLS